MSGKHKPVPAAWARMKDGEVAYAFADRELAEFVAGFAANELVPLYLHPQPATDAALVEALEWLRGAINCTPENDKHQSGAWISTKHPRIRQIDELLAAYRKQETSHDNQ